MIRITDQILKIQKTESRKPKDRKSLVVSRQSLTTYYLRLTVVILLTTSGLYGAFEDIGVGARPVSMGAYTAVCDDANAVFYNPAGLSRFIYPELTSSYGKLYWGLNGPNETNLSNSSIAFVYPVRKSGKNRYNESSNGVDPKDSVTLGFGWLNLSLQEYYTENSLLASYGRNVTNKISLGLNLKYLSRTYGSDIYTPRFEVFKNGYSKSVFSSDVGFLFRENAWSVALFSADVNQPDIGLKYTDKLPMLVKLAAACKIRSLNIGFDTFYKNKRYGILLGGEKTFEAFAVRGGFEFGKDNLKNLTIGFGNRFADKFIVDYAFLYPFSGIKEIIGTHKISLGFKFGPLPKDKIPAQLTEEEKKEVMAEHYSKGVMYYKDGKYNEAVSQFEEILKLESGHIQSKRLIEQCKAKIEVLSSELYDKGRKEYAKNNINGAISFWKKAYDIAPKDEKINNALKEALSRKLYSSGLKEYTNGNIAGAISFWERAHNLAPENEKIMAALKKAKSELKKGTGD